MTYFLPRRPISTLRSVPDGAPERFRVYTERHLGEIPQLAALPAEQRFAIRVVSSVLPFRVNDHVEWDRVPNDPIFQLVFPQRRMLSEEHFARVAALVRRSSGKEELGAVVDEVREELNPHPAGQQEHNVPLFRGRPLAGVQHKYRETVLFFPSQGQTCHAYCSFCFRWAQFVGAKGQRFSETDASQLHDYLAEAPEVTDLLVTGGDPMIMKAKVLQRYLAPLLEPRLEHVQSIRIGSKALSFWPQRFVTDEDADQLLRLFERLVAAGKHLAFMAHFDHWREFDNDICHRAIGRLQDAGVVIRAQAPLLAHINDGADIWATMWRNQVRLGIVPYYMFVERDTGARAHFEVPLARAYEIYSSAMRRLSGLARTARGPSMSAGPGKVEVQGVTEVDGEKVFVLRFIQARNPDWVQRPFFARYDERATWLDQLRPTGGEQEFFFEEHYRQICHRREEAHDVAQ